MSSGLLVGPEDYKYAVFDTNLSPIDIWRDTVRLASSRERHHESRP
jgi:hypothetical protein